MISQHFEMSASVKVVCVISIHIVFLGGTSTERCWTTASMISVALCTRVAPSRISWLQPFYLGSSGDPGMAITSLPRSPASRAVISNPDLVAASITTAPSARRGSRAHFGQKQSFINDLQKQGSIFRWIDNINTASNYPNRARFHGTAMDKWHQYRAPCQTQSHSLPRQARAPEFRHCEWH